MVVPFECSDQLRYKVSNRELKQMTAVLVGLVLLQLVIFGTEHLQSDSLSN